MPVCRFGSGCQLKYCEFRHLRDEDKEDCANYELGFCHFGPACRYRYAWRRFFADTVEVPCGRSIASGVTCLVVTVPGSVSRYLGGGGGCGL